MRDGDFRVRMAAATALGYIGSDSSIPLLIRNLRDEQAEVRKQSVWALKMYGPRAAVAVTDIEKLKDDPNKWVRIEAREALKRIRYR